MLYRAVFETPLGWVGAIASERGLRRCTLPQWEPGECVQELGGEFADALEAPDRFAELEALFDRYFADGRESFAGIPIDVEDAAPFQHASWLACRSIPSGETRTYKWLAARAGSPSASRAAGQAMARNRLPIVVPCHRVIGVDGSLRGYGSGARRLDLKRRLLDLEGGVRRLGV